jgi:hypothetical protein
LHHLGAPSVIVGGDSHSDEHGDVFGGNAGV